MRTASLLVGLGLAILTGCAPGYHQAHMSTGGAFAVGALAGALVVAAADHPEPPRETIVYYEPQQPVYVTPLDPTPTPPPHVDDLPPFNPVAARIELENAADFDGCGAPAATYGHAKVNFEPDGAISKVTVDEPANLPRPVAQCIGDRLGRAHVASFRGGTVSMGTSFRTH
jgi:hypothetical protein